MHTSIKELAVAFGFSQNGFSANKVVSSSDLAPLSPLLAQKVYFDIVGVSKQLLSLSMITPSHNSCASHPGGVGCRVRFSENMVVSSSDLAPVNPFASGDGCQNKVVSSSNLAPVNAFARGDGWQNKVISSSDLAPVNPHSTSSACRISC